MPHSQKKLLLQPPASMRQRWGERGQSRLAGAERSKQQPDADRQQQKRDGAYLFGTLPARVSLWSSSGKPHGNVSQLPLEFRLNLT